jgi:phenylpropionate dioxygenase-like ring-hydroxylating dioxygenase large terminal subunit
MPEDGSNLIAIRPANAANDFDLRRVGTHPDYWYPLAWSDELAPGKLLARRFAGDPIVLYRGNGGRVFALEDRCAHRQVPLSQGVVSGDEVKCGYHGWAYNSAGKCVDVPYLGKERLPNGVKSYPAREVDGLIFFFPGDPAMAEARAPAALGSSADQSFKTRKLNREVACHYTFMHENLFDMNHQFLHRKQMGMIKAKCLGKRMGEDWAEVDYTFSRTEGKSSLGEKVIVDLVRTRGEAKKDFSDLMTIRTDYPYQRLKVWVGREVGDQSHLRLSVGQEAARAGSDPCGLAVRDLVHRENFHRGQGRGGVRAEGARRTGRRLEQRGVPRHPRSTRRARSLRRSHGSGPCRAADLRGGVGS